MKHATLFIALGGIVCALPWPLDLKWPWWLLWPGLNMIFLGIAYLRGDPLVFGKQTDGRLSKRKVLFFLPWLLLTRFVWHLSLLLLPESPIHLITSKLSVGRRLLSHELPNEIELVVDLTSEFEEPAGICERVAYLALPILDASAPEPRELLASMEAIDLSKHVLVHCAQGHGRTGLVAAVVLMMRGQARNADEALATLRGIRPGVGLSHVQMECLQACEMILQRKGCYSASGSC
ncbi:MAG: dual specificity protein phosphatase family protein [Verrucomicrobiaceae bacterium]|nr:dual specificity protein phosphatase family protein [Verrucomicrobiaceae bacterium]